jgi:hypothetical protein
MWALIGCFLDQTPKFEWCVVRCGSKNGPQKRHVFRRYRTTCSKFVNQSRINIQSMIGGPIKSFDAHNIFYCDNEYDINMSSEKYEEKGFGIWTCHSSSRTNCVFTSYEKS